MACISELLTGGISLGCENNSGGIRKIYITDYVNITGTTEDADQVITAIDLAGVRPAHWPSTCSRRTLIMKAGFQPLASEVSEIHPSQMGAGQRAQEIADLLATAWLRGRYLARMREHLAMSQAPVTHAVTLCDTTVETDLVRLGLTADQSVKTNPSQPEGVQ